MEERVVIHNQDICNQIDMLLIQNGKRKNSIFNTIAGYTKEELQIVNEITLECSESIEELLLLPNLKSLKIISQNQDTIIKANPFQINNIHDFSFLSYLTNLEELVIENDVNIETLVLTPLKNLKILKICNNFNLTEIIGLDTLEKLDKILIYGNKKEPDIDPILYLNNTGKAKKNYLDITMFYNMSKKNPKFKEIYLNYIDHYKTNLEFVEKVGIFNRYVPFRPSAVLRIYEEAEEILNNLSFKFKFSTKDKIKSLYHYARKKIEYDYETLDYRDTSSLELANTDKHLSYQMSFPNTSYSALVGKKTVCEGYSNMLHLLLHMNGIESKVIYCSRPGQFINGLNHAALKVKYHNEYFYMDADPNWAKDDTEFFLISKEEFQKTHVLSAIEEVKGCDSYDVKRYIK